MLDLGLVSLQPKQWQMLERFEATGECPTILGTGGSRGSAKSGCLRRCAILLACKYSKIVIYIVRRVLGDLLENHMEKIKIEFPAVHEFYRAGDYEYALPNGSRIVFVAAQHKVDVDRVSYGPECTFLFVDQAEQFTEEELTSFRICNRWTNPDVPLPRGFVKTCLFFNVGMGLGAQYLRRIFHLKQFRQNELPGEYYFLQTYGWDNYEWFRGSVDIGRDKFYELSSEDRLALYISQTSEGRKMNALPKHRREGEMMGNFDSFSGQYFSDVWGEHCILTPAEVDAIVQPWWTCWMAQDWGFGDHTCHLWFVTGKLSPELWAHHFGGQSEWPIDIAIIYRELLVVGRAEGDLATDIVTMTPVGERTQIKEFFLSEDAFGKRSKQAGSQNTVGQTFATVMHRHGLPEPSAAFQDRVNGWRFLYNSLRQAGLRGCNVDVERAKQGPALFISADCPVVLENFPLAVRDDTDPNDVMRVAGAVWEDVTDACLVGETLVTMADGTAKRIDAIAVGDVVLSSHGPKRVKHAWMSGTNRPVFSVLVSDGHSVTCTLNHRFSTEKGFIRADALRYGDKMVGWWNSTVESTNQTRPDTSSLAEFSFTGKSGKAIVGRFLRSITSTTKTAIEQITTFQTWIAYQRRSTARNMAGFVSRIYNYWKEFALWQRNGIAQKLGGDGTALMHLPTLPQQSHLRAITAGHHISAAKDGSARMLASLRAGESAKETHYPLYAESAILRSKPTDSSPQNAARANVPRFLGLIEAGNRDVFDLEVEDAHDFFANGILVHNCRYGMYSKLAPKKKAPVEVRAAEVAASASSPTEKHIKMLHFKEQERRRGLVNRSPRWR